MNSAPDLFRKSNLFLLFCVVVAWICFYTALSTDNSTPPPGDGNGPNQTPTTPPAGDGPPAGRMSKPPPAAFTESDSDLLEKEYEIFNVPVLNISSLGKILQEDLGLELEIPPSAESLRLEAVESGGRPLGAILVGLLSPHDHVIFRQGAALRIVPGKYKRQSKPSAEGKEEFRSCNVETIFRAKWAEPVDLWLDTSPPLKLRVAIQPLFEESEVRQVYLSVEGRRDQHLWFRQILDVPLGQPARIETKGTEWMWLTLEPTDLDDEEITLEVKFNHEFTVSLP